MRVLLTVATLVAIPVGTAFGAISSRLMMPSAETVFESGTTLSRLDAPVDLHCRGEVCQLCVEAHHAGALQVSLCASDEQRILGALAGSVTTAFGLIAFWSFSGRRQRRRVVAKNSP
jgi:hypothetical protein